MIQLHEQEMYILLASKLSLIDAVENWVFDEKQLTNKNLHLITLTTTKFIPHVFLMTKFINRHTGLR